MYEIIAVCSTIMNDGYEINTYFAHSSEGMTHFYEYHIDKYISEGRIRKIKNLEC